MVGGNTLYGRSHQHTAASEQEFFPIIGGVACLDFVNTVDHQDATARHDAFAPGYANLLAWFEHARLVDSDTATALLRLARKEPREAVAVRKRAQSLRTAIREITFACITGATPSDDALTIFNAEVRRALGCGGFVPADRVLSWQWTATPELDAPLWPIARSAAGLLSGDRLARVRECAGDGCSMLFLDESKNRSRRFCSTSTCGNAMRVRRFRERRGAASAAHS